MMTKTLFLWAALLLFGASQPASAQVIEIDQSGGTQTFNEPMVFTGDQIRPVRPDAAIVEVAPSPAIFKAVAQAHGLDPNLLAAVAWQESRGRMSAVSLKGARGIMQLMPGTAAELGVRPDDLSDNIRGGALYLRRQLDRFGSVPLALAAYNAGPGAVLRFGGIPPYRETRNYVASILGRWRPIASAQAIPERSIEVLRP